MQRQALRIYWSASLLAVIEAFFLFTYGLELQGPQIVQFCLFGFPAPVFMYLCDRWLIIRHTRPIDRVLCLQAGAASVPQTLVQVAYAQTLNLPLLTFVRVLTVHALTVLVPLTGLCLLANAVVGMGLAWWQFIVLWSFWPITAAPHAIVEYFLIDRAAHVALDRLSPLLDAPLTSMPPQASRRGLVQLLLGAQPTSPRMIRSSAGLQLAWLFFFVSLMPMLVLGASVMLKITAMGEHVARTILLASLAPWLTLLLLLNTGISIAIVTLLSRRVHNAMVGLLRRMQQVLSGDLSGFWSPYSTDEFFDLGVGFNAMLAGLRESQMVKDTFGRFVSRHVAEAILGGRVPLQGELREVSILFQDIRGFTTLSEQVSPEALLHLLNEFFTEMVAAVEAHGGTVKQFTGDGVMALFGAPVPYPDAPSRAVRAALEMFTRLEDLNRRRRTRGDVPLRIGVGVHTGLVVAGCIGPDTRVEYSVVGDAVNLASRVQELTKQVGTPLLVTDATAALLTPGFRFGARTVLPVRGKHQPITVCEVLGETPTGTPVS